MDKILHVILQELNTGKVSATELRFIFENHTELKQKILDTDITLSLKNHQDEKISLPLLNILLLLIHHTKRNEVIELFDNVQAFKEVYLHRGDKRFLVHGLDLFSITNSSFTKHFDEKKALNIRSLEQFYSMLKKGESENTNYGFNIQPWRLSKYINMEFVFDDIFINKQPSGETFNYTNVQLIDEENRFVVSSYFQLVMSNITQADRNELKNIGSFLRYTLTNNDVIAWDNEKFIRLMAQSNHVFTSDDEAVSLLKNIALRYPQVLTKEAMSICYLKHKNAYTTLLKMTQEKKFPIYDAPPVYELERTDMEQKVQSWQDYINHINTILLPYANVDKEIYQQWHKILVQVNFLKEDRSIEYFQDQMEDRILIEQILADYIPRILTNYFQVPERLRLSEKTEFKTMTIAQLTQIHTQLEEVEVKILEEDLRRMRVFGKFLDKKMPVENNLIKPVLK